MNEWTRKRESGHHFANPGATINNFSSFRFSFHSWDAINLEFIFGRVAVAAALGLFRVESHYNLAKLARRTHTHTGQTTHARVLAHGEQSCPFVNCFVTQFIAHARTRALHIIAIRRRKKCSEKKKKKWKSLGNQRRALIPWHSSWIDSAGHTHRESESLNWISFVLTTPSKRRPSTEWPCRRNIKWKERKKRKNPFYAQIHRFHLGFSFYFVILAARNARIKRIIKWMKNGKRKSQRLMAEGERAFAEI